MPLDYSLWSAIETKMVEDGTISGTESRKAFLARLSKAAKSLPKTFVKKVLGQMKKRIKATVEAKGRHINALD